MEHKIFLPFFTDEKFAKNPLTLLNCIAYLSSSNGKPQQLKNTDHEAAVTHYQTVKKTMDETFEKIDGKYFIYRPLFLTSVENEAEARAIEAQLKKYDCEMTMI
ncbi:MAG: hypothetical protein EOO20_05185 [Chryseobacterium sp.]|nr:MAG: hypothetical protein EOO20_05185 [Chryseobacterium sp.]